MSSEPSTRDLRAFIAGIGVLAVIALFMAILAFGRSLAGPVGAAGEAPTTTIPAPSAPAEVAVTLSEFALTPADITVAAGGTLVVTNAGGIAHDLAVEGTDLITPMLGPGESARLELGGLAPGTYRVLCAVPGHDAAGMTGTLVVVEGAAALPDPGGHDGHGARLTPEEMAENMRRSIEAFPAATEGTGNLPMEPTILPDGTKEFVLVAAPIRWEVEPGKVVDAVAYNGQIPGPVIRVDVGDRVRIVVENQLDEITSWHPHGVRRHPIEADGVGFITQNTIYPGETWSVEFIAEEQSVGMYHAHDMGIHQVPNGLAGAFIVGEVPVPEGIEVVAEEFIFLNDAGNIGFALNGKSFPATTPYVLRQGEVMMVHYMNEGLMNHPMHLHNNRQLVIAKDGFPLDSPYYVDTLDVAPGERYTVLVFAELPGVWVWHCHIFTHVERSDGTMFGMITALIVEE